MYFQKVLKGINGLSRSEAEDIVYYNGIPSNLLRNNGELTGEEIKTELTKDNLIHHLNDYGHPLPAGHHWGNVGSTFGDVSAFVSTTAGTIHRNRHRNIPFDPFITALKFATDGFRSDGYIFYAYVMTLGKQSIPLEGFAEEVRELHIYTQRLPYHHEGEITAKIYIPSVNIQKAEYYNAAQAKLYSKQAQLLQPGHTITNPDYAAPDNFNNIRELL